MGYHRSGFDVVGVDINPQPNYPFEFMQADVRTLTTADFGPLDAVHASPPCQGYTTMNNRHGSSSPLLIDGIRRALQATELPYVIENVAGALGDMRSPVTLTGEMFGLRVHRPRLFETNFPVLVPGPSARQLDPVAVYGKNDQRRLWTRSDGSELRAATLKDASEAMGIDWMTWDEIREAIPPAYTEHIGSFLIEHLKAVAA